MVEVELKVPDTLADALPADGDDAVADMHQAVEGWETRINRRLREDDPELVDVIDRFEDRWERYDDFIVELRAWGQSPIYAMAWRDLHEAVIKQLYEYDEIADRIDRQRHARIVEDGIRWED